MNQYNLPKYFEQVLDKDEKMLWVGQPKFIPFLASGIPFLIVGLLWFSFDYFFFMRNVSFDDAGFLIPFLLCI